MAKPLHVVALNDVSAIATGASIDTNGHFLITMVTTATGASPQATVVLEGSVDGTNFYPIISRDVTAATTHSDSITGAHFIIRARVSAYTSGTLRVVLIMTGNPDVGF